MADLAAGIKEGLFEPDTVADYLLFKLNLRLAAEAGLPADDPSRREYPYCPAVFANHAET